MEWRGEGGGKRERGERENERQRESVLTVQYNTPVFALYDQREFKRYGIKEDYGFIERCSTAL